MTIQIKLFANLRELIEASELTWQATIGSTVESVWKGLAERYPRLQPFEESILFAVNQTYVQRTHPLNDGDELVLIPPVSGG